MSFVVAKQSQVRATTASGLCFDKHNQHSPSVGMVCDWIHHKLNAWNTLMFSDQSKMIRAFQTFPRCEL